MKASSKRKHFDVSADLTATMVWARFSYRYLTAAHGMPRVDDRNFCCKSTTNCGTYSRTPNSTCSVRLVHTAYLSNKTVSIISPRGSHYFGLEVKLHS